MKTTVAQKDYVSRGRTGNSRKKNKNKRDARPVSLPLLLLAIGVLVTFAGGLYYLKNHKNSDTESLQSHSQDKKSTLPPRPEKRWTYPDKLEKPRDAGVNLPPAQDNAIAPNAPLNEEQRQLLAQMQADMRQSTLSLPGTYNQQVAPRDNTATPPVTAPAKTETTPITPPPVRTPTRTPEPTPSASATKPPVEAPITSARPTVTKPSVDSPISSTKPTVTNTENQNWMLQCGSFRNPTQADSVKAMLALSGISSQIRSREGWHRVVLGPYRSRDAANAMLPKLQNAGVSGCISIAPRG